MTMQGSIAVSPSPVIMENFVFRHKLGLSLCTSSVQLLDRNSSNVHNTARCLFGPPDPKQAKDLVREVDSQNAINFGKRFNFDIVSGEPILSAKRMKMSHVPETNDSDEENVAMIDEEDDPEEGYIWAETYDEDYMAMCNKHTVNTSIVGPNRHVVSLLIAPVTTNHTFRSSASLESPLNLLNQSSSSSQKKVHPSSSSFPSSFETPLLPSPSSENNNNRTIETNNNDDKKSAVKHQEKRNNRSSRMHHNHHQNQPSAKKTYLSSLTKYTNRVLKHAVMKKTRKNIITDYLHMRRVKNGQAGKK